MRRTVCIDLDAMFDDLCVHPFPENLLPEAPAEKKKPARMVIDLNREYARQPMTIGQFIDILQAYSPDVPVMLMDSLFCLTNISADMFYEEA